MEAIEVKLTELSGDLKAFVAKAAEEKQAHGTMQEETKSAIANIRGQMEKMQTQIDAVDLKTAQRLVGGLDAQPTIADEVLNHEVYQDAKKHGFPGKRPLIVHLKSSAFPMERKTNITTGTLGAGTSGVLMPQRLEDLTRTARIGLRIRDLLKIRTIEKGNSFDWVRQTVQTNAASPQVEASAKSESTYLWDAQSGTVKTIAHFTNVSRQALDDVDWLRDELDTELMFGLKLKEEQEILAGDGTGQHLNGIITQASAYNVGYNVAGDTYLDQLRHAKLQARLAGLATFAPDGIVLHPTDLAKIELIKTEEGGANKGVYVVGNPISGIAVPTIWGLPVVESDSISQGRFLVGAFGTAATLIDRQQASVEISFEHDQNFTKNLATLLCEERVGLAIRRPAAFITGSFV